MQGDDEPSTICESMVSHLLQIKWVFIECECETFREKINANWMRAKATPRKIDIT